MASVFRRNVTVSFYIAEPVDPPTWSDNFPSDEVLSKIRGLDLASGDYHVKTGLFATELFCMVHNVLLPLVGAYSKDMWNAVLTELKGVIEEVEMREGEGVVDGAYAAFFPNSVVGDRSVLGQGARIGGARTMALVFSEVTRCTSLGASQGRRPSGTARDLPKTSSVRLFE